MKPFTLAVFLTLAYLPIFSQDVYMSDYSSVYHIEGCEKINKRFYKTSLKVVLKNNFKPCGLCNPPTAIIVDNNVNTSNDNTPLSFTKIIMTDSVGKNSLFVKINDWFATNYKSANDVIQMIDKDAGIIIGRGALRYSYGGLQYLCYDGYINYTIKVYVKDNRYKIEFLNINHIVNNNDGLNSLCALGNLSINETPSYNGVGKKYYYNVWIDAKEKIKSESESIFTALEMYTKNMSTSEDGDGW